MVMVALVVVAVVSFGLVVTNDSNVNMIEILVKSEVFHNYLSKFMC